MRTLFYNTRDYEKPFLLQGQQSTADEVYLPDRLMPATVSKAAGFDVVSIFTSDDASSEVIGSLYDPGVRFIAVRATGIDNIDLDKAKSLGMVVANVPGYSPNAIAEHAVALILALDRKLVLADRQVHLQNFTTGNLVGFDLKDKIVGIIGCGRIGQIFAKIMHGFGCRLLGYDLVPDRQLSIDYQLEFVRLEELISSSDIISLHTGLTPSTFHIVNTKMLSKCKPGCMLINTSRGACVDTQAVIEALESTQLGSYGADVYEKEKDIFFKDCSAVGVNDPLLEKLLSLHNVLVTPHQAFATIEAFTQIAAITRKNLRSWKEGKWSGFELVKPGSFNSTKKLKKIKSQLALLKSNLCKVQ